MEANELRIGNWLNWNGSPSQIQSGGIHLFEEGKLHIEPKPIPLTEEWLVRFGFKTFDLGGELLNYQIGYDGQFILSVDGGYVLSENIKHVHQLQNLYFTLTGEELKTNR